MFTTIAYHIVDAFTTRPFAGNPASVVLFSEKEDEQKLAADDEFTQALAAEFNLSETAFARRCVAEGTEEEPVYELRWKTPSCEVQLCGHATLATSHILFSTIHPTATSIHYKTRFKGSLFARRTDDGLISLDFPIGPLLILEDGHRRRPKLVKLVDDAAGLKEDVIKRVAWFDIFDCGIIELDENVDLAGLEVKAAGQVHAGMNLIFTQPAPAGSGYDTYSRLFVPNVGVDEDPVTGAAHTSIAPFWLCYPDALSRLHRSAEIKVSKTLRAKQVSKRGGEMVIVLDEAKGRVELRGGARTVMKGEVLL